MLDDYTPHQQRIIKRYYNNQDTIQQQRLAELVTELYLAEGKKRQRAWAAAARDQRHPVSHAIHAGNSARRRRVLSLPSA